MEAPTAKPTKEQIAAQLEARHKERTAAGTAPASEHAPPSEEEFAAASKPAPKPVKAPKVASVSALAKNPGADKAALKAFADAAPSPAAKEAILDAEHNAHSETSAIARSPDEIRRHTVERLGAAWRDALETGDKEGADYAAKVLQHFGASLHGEAPGSVVPFDSRRYDSEHSVMSGNVKVLRQPVVLRGKDGSEHVAVKGRVGPA